MQSRLLIGVSMLTLVAVACGGDSKNPAAPSAAAGAGPTAITIAPGGVGLEGVTQFTFSVGTVASTQSSFEWDFGDGSRTTGGATAAHVYARSGTFTVQVRTAGQAGVTSTVRVASLVGTWIATMTGHTHLPIQRPIPITSIELRLDQSPTGADPVSLVGTWRDDAGCRAGTGYQSALLGSVRDPRTVAIGAGSLYCNDGDLYLNGTADEELSVITGTCPQGGPDCRFVMVRR